MAETIVTLLFKQFFAKLAELSEKFVGPCKVVKIILPVVYEVEDLDNLKVYRRHIDHLKGFTLKYNKLPTETEIQKTVSIPDLDSRQKVVLHSSNRKANKV